MAEPTLLRYADQNALVNAVAGTIAAALDDALKARGRASLIVSGGKSPIGLFEALRTRMLEWRSVAIGLVDERWVDVSDPASNEKLVRDHLLTGAAGAARFQGLKNGAATPELGTAAAWKSLASMPRPFDVVVLGMGDDGHTASLFPSSPGLAAALDPAAAPGCVSMSAPAAPRPRISLNLSALLDSRRIILLLSGDSKKRVYDAAVRPGAADDMPIRAILRQTRVPVDVTWAP